MATYQEIVDKIKALHGVDASVEDILRAMAQDAQFGGTDWVTVFQDLTVSSIKDLTNVAVATDYTASIGQFLSVTCSTVNITITLPAAADNEGGHIYINKVDATAYKVVVTGVKDIEFQNSTMHLISNGVDWKIS